MVDGGWQGDWTVPIKSLGWREKAASANKVATEKHEIVFKHHRRTENLGDAVCSPFDYFPDLAKRGIALDLTDPTPDTRAVIYGGGKIMGGLRRTLGPGDLAADHRIAWGVSTVQSKRISIKYWRAFRKMHLVGSRDWGDDRFDFAPCSTCLSHLFEIDFEETHDVVLYLHHWKSAKQGVVRPKGVPVLENNNPSLENTIRHLASGRVVVSNSYHGVYWGLLLGKAVLCLPFSNKFGNYRVSPGYADPARWHHELSNARKSDEMLELCRDASNRFASKVRTELAV